MVTYIFVPWIPATAVPHWKDSCQMGFYAASAATILRHQRIRLRHRTGIINTSSYLRIRVLRYLCGQYGKKLNPHHIGRSDTGDMAVRALGSRHYLSKWLIRRGLMAECKEAPIIRIAKTFAVFDHHVEAVEGTREISSARS